MLVASLLSLATIQLQFSNFNMENFFLMLLKYSKYIFWKAKDEEENKDAI